MKTKFFFFALMIATIDFCSGSLAHSALGASSGALISTDKYEHDYGTIEQGTNGECFFVILNSGDEPLIISECRGSCSCTIPEWPKEPIAPGKSATIKVKYDTNRIGPINKSIRVSSNAANSPLLTLTIKGNVIPKVKP